MAAAAVVLASLGLLGSIADAGAACVAEDASDRPNILFCISDDQTWLHAGAYGDPVVETPAFDWVARHGVLFQNAFCVTPSCTPSRGTILTGQHTWRLGEGANLHSSLPAGLATFPNLLEQAGYEVGYTRKGWGPGNWKAGGRTRNPAGNGYKSFDAFLETKPAEKPFCFWFGSNDPHRPYEFRSGVNEGKSPADVRVPGWLPDTAEIRSDILDYYVEIERFDRDVSRLLEQLRTSGQLENTLVVVTSDNGMPFPRAKTTLYDSGTRMPLAVCWQAKIPGGRTVDDFISFVDFAPTFLEAAGLTVPSEVTGRGFLGLLLSGQSGRVESGRDHVLLARERHVAYRPGGVGYPARAIRTGRYLYIRNLAADRWPAAEPPHFVDVDRSPSKFWMMLNRDRPEVEPLFDLAFLKRPAEELYDLDKDPWQLENVAELPEYLDAKKRLAKRLAEELIETGDPRAMGKPVSWDSDPYYGGPKDAWLRLQAEMLEDFRKASQDSP